MGRFVASQEGFLDSVGKFFKEAGASLNRSAAIGAIYFQPGKTPEVNGIPAKDFRTLTAMLQQAVASNGTWDATIVTGVRSVSYDHEKPLDQRQTTTYKDSVIVFIGEGNNVKVRLPGYTSGDSSARTAYFLIDELGLNRVL